MFRKPAFYIKMVAGTVTVFATTYSLLVAGPELERRFYPVTTDFSIVEMQEVEPSLTAITVEFNKVRTCRLLGQAWYMYLPGGQFVRVPIDFGVATNNDNVSFNRPEGYQRAGPWYVAVPVEVIKKEQGFAETIHQCHPFWPTVTQIFP